jgi:hypothetical protein
MEMPSASVARLLSLGPLQAIRNNRPVHPPCKVRALLTYLAVAPQLIICEKLFKLLSDVVNLTRIFPFSSRFMAGIDSAMAATSSCAER